LAKGDPFDSASYRLGVPLWREALAAAHHPPPPLTRLNKINTLNDVLLATSVRSQNHSDATRRLCEALPAGTRLTLFSADKPDRFFTIIKFWTDETSGVALELKTGVPSYQVEDEEGRTHLLIHLPIEEKG
jgi:hypothetical protein